MEGEGTRAVGGIGAVGDVGAARGMGMGSMGPSIRTGATGVGRGTVRHMA